MCLKKILKDGASLAPNEKTVKKSFNFATPLFFLGGGRSAYYKAMEVDLF